MSFIHTPGSPNTNSATINAVAIGGEQVQTIIISDRLSSNRASVDSAGGVAVLLRNTANAPALTSVACVTNTASLLAANTNRLMAMFFNEATTPLYLKLGATASLTSYSVQIPTLSLFELPSPVYSGAIDGIWSGSSVGSVRITEVT